MNSVRLRLIFWNLLVFALALVALGLILREQMRANLSRQIDRELTHRVRPMLAGPIALPGVSDDFIREMQQRWKKAEREGKREGRPVTPDGRPLGPPLYDRTGRNIITGASPADLVAVKQVARTGGTLFTTVDATLDPSLGPEPVRTFTSPVRDTGGGIAAIVQTVEPLTPIHQEVAHLTRTLITLIPIALLIAGIGAAFLTDRALQPVREVTRTAAAIQATDLSRRLTSGGKDEFGRLAETFNGMLSRLETAFAQQKRFVADASHELRTPLTVIKANTSLALAEPDTASETREVLRDIDHAADRTIRIVQDLLLLARSDSGELPLLSERLDLCALLEQTAAEGRKLYPDGPDIQVVTGESPLPLTGDRHYLLRLLGNLTENALRHTPKDGSVLLTAKTQKRHVLIEVADTGVGIAPEHLPHIGERFYRADASRTRSGGGTGLGIAISRTIAEGHGGGLSIESIVGCGTTVRVLLRRESAAAEGE